jgi:putative membrane protein
MWWWHHGGGWPGGGFWMFGVVFWALGIAAVVILILTAVRRSTGLGRGWHGSDPDALEIARRRYARGEITKEQYDQLKKDLTQ